MPSVLDLGRRLAAYGAPRRRRPWGAHFGTDESTCDEARTLLYDQILGLRHLITTTPPSTVGDVAVQMAHIAKIAGDMASHNSTDQEVHERANVMERLALCAVPILAAAAGLDMEAMDFAGNNGLRPRRWEALEAVS